MTYRLSLKDFVKASSLYPVTACYVAAVVAIVAVAANWIRVEVGIVLLGFAAVLIVLLAVRRDAGRVAEVATQLRGELKTVHGLVNHSHEEAMARIDQLIAALITAGVKVPEDPTEPEANAAKREHP